MSLAIRLGLIALAMTVFLGAMVVRHAALRANGTEIILPMEPVDPRDMLLGYYIIIRTPAHNLDTGTLDGPDAGWTPGDTIYVTLEQGADGVQPAGAYPARPENGVFIQGRVAEAYSFSDMRDVEAGSGDDESWLGRSEPIPGTERQALQVVYNLERYYTDAATAQELEAMRRENRLRLIVAVGEDGSAVIRGLEIDGEAHVQPLF
jgi:uncharacterized membrane-anchored protein